MKPSAESIQDLVVGAVVVTYNPDMDALVLLLRQLRRQTQHIIVVDNHSSNDIERIPPDLSSIEIIKLNSNVGVASAQNVGIRRACALGARYVAIFDQDSLPQEGMIDGLLRTLRAFNLGGSRVAAVGPACADGRWSRQLPFVRMHGLRYRRIYPGDTRAPIEVDHLISSGTLIRADVFDDVGLMNDSLFIDYVDIEWCMRARMRGYALYGVPESQLYHSLGDNIVNIFGASVGLHSPLRDYYLFRNGTWLISRGRLPLQWKLIETARLISRFVIYAMTARTRSHAKSMLLGVADGVRGRLGKTTRSL